MEFRLDSHTHTLASGHAYCTLLEMVRAAADRGLELICITDHAPGMELTTHKDYFLNFRVIDREIYGVRVMMGAELNVMDFDGTVDLSPKLLNNLDMAIASQHIWCMPQGGGPEENTAAMVLAMDNCPKICILGHPDDGRYPLDYPALVRAAGERSVLLEVNNTSLSPACSRVNSTANVTEMLKHCRREGVPVVVGSDAHFVSAVGGHQYAQALLDELARADPDTAARLHPNDRKRIVRALEVFQQTGKTISQHNRETRALPLRYDALTLSLAFQRREDMWARIDRRVDEMMAAGLAEEVRALLDSGVPVRCTAMQAIGYKEMAAALRGGGDVCAAAEEIKLRSRQYAKRQLTWFRRTEGAKWLFWGPEPDFEAACRTSTKYLEEFGLV